MPNLTLLTFRQIVYAVFYATDIYIEVLYWLLSKKYFGQCCSEKDAPEDKGIKQAQPLGAFACTFKYIISSRQVISYFLRFALEFEVSVEI